MSTSEGPKHSLIARAEDGARVTVLDARLQVVAQGFGQLDLALAPAIYKVRFETGLAVEQHMVDLTAGSRVECISQERHAFASAAPLDGTTKSREYHQALVAHAYQAPTARWGSGAALLLTSRVWAKDDAQRSRQKTSPANGLRLLKSDGTAVLDLDRHPAALRVPSSGQQDAAYAIRVEVDPGAYLVEVDLGNGQPRIRLAIAAEPQWETQLFFMQRDIQLNVHQAPASVPDLASAGISMVRSGTHFRPDDEELRRVELMRIALFSGADASTEDVHLSCGQAFQNPMLGILTGHLVARSRALDADVRRRAIQSVLSGLERLGVASHPDARALRLAIGDLEGAGTFRDPPLLLPSWTLIREASITRPDLVPEGSELSRAVRQLWGAGPWLLWVYDSEMDAPASAPARMAREEHEVLQRFSRGTRFASSALGRGARGGGGSKAEAAPMHAAMVEVAREMGLPFGDVERIVVKHAVKGTTRMEETLSSSAPPEVRPRVKPSPGRARMVSAFIQSLFSGEAQAEAADVGSSTLVDRFQESTGASEEQVTAAVRGLKTALGGGVAAEEDVGFLEAIVLKDKCPTLAIFEDDLAEPPRGEWKRLETDRAWLKDVIRAVGRIDCNALNVPYAGSGFMVGDDLVMTNRHVARLFANGVGLRDELSKKHDSQLDYLREKARPTRRDPTDVVEVLMIHPYWDVSILRVKRLAGRSPLELAHEPPAAGFSNREVAVIGYPFFQFLGSDYDRDVLLDNFGDTPGFKRLQPGRLTEPMSYIPETIEFPRVMAVGHNASTLGGNSGSAVIDLDTHRAFAVHFAGQPLVTNWAVPTWELYRDPRVRELGVRFSGNGVAPPAPDREVEAAWGRLSSARTSVSVPEALRSSETSPVSAVVLPEPSRLPSASLTTPSKEQRVNVSVVVDIGSDGISAVRIQRNEAAAAAAGSSALGPSVVAPSAGALETTAIDPDWGTRQGYDQDFLGTAISLPTLSDKLAELAVPVPAEHRDPRSKFLLNYHHYSVVMHGRRRIALFSAANIDGDRRFKFERGKDKWFIDDRIDDPEAPRFQMGEELYRTANSDRGHLTRYLDVAWGDDIDEARNATNDSFHFTNCALQLSDFNQSKERWQGLERFILEEKARKEKRRMSVFTGPVLKRTDPVYRNKFMDYSIRIPLQFWKLCAIVRPDDTLSVTAFVLGQPDVTEVEGFEEAIDAGAAQITVAHLEKLTGLDFGKLKQHDHLAAGGMQGTLEGVKVEGINMPVRRLGGLESIVV